MPLVFVGLGSNLGNGQINLQQAWKRLSAVQGILALSLSSPFLTEPVGMESEYWFTNAVGVLETRISPENLLSALLQIEEAMGRDRSQGMDRTVDLDLLFYDDLIMETEDLILPHPELHNRLFVLAPLEELAPDHIHPQTSQTITQMRRLCSVDNQSVKKHAWNLQ